MVDYVPTPWRQPPRLAWIALIVALVLSMLVVLRILTVFMSVIFMALVAAAVLYHPFRWLAAGPGRRSSRRSEPPCPLSITRRAEMVARPP